MSNSRFDFDSTPISGLTVIQRKLISDDRGFFSRFFDQFEFREAGIVKPIIQMNHSNSKNRGVVRGLHYQHPPHAETKVISCLKGEVYDVAVDLRRESPTFLQWHSEILSASNHKGLLIPEGFAHGFQTLTDDCELIYLHTAAYAAKAEAGINVNDPQLAISWPLDIIDLSDRDRSHPNVDINFEGIQI